MIYLDNSATTFLYEEVKKEIMAVYEEVNFNPSSAYDVAYVSEKKLKEARKTLARSIGAREEEVVFTSGGSESNNMALFGVARANRNRGKHIISSPIEHDSVYKILQYLENEGYEISFAKPNKQGEISCEEVASLVREDTVLVSLMQVNNETGAINPIEEMARRVKAINPLTFFHSDCVQSYMKVPIDMSKSKVDILSMSGHKVHAGKGTGAIFIRKNTKMLPLIFGGGQESGWRGGTENVAGICGFAKAVELQADRLEEFSSHTYEVKEYLRGKLQEEIPDVRFNTPMEGAPHILSASFAGVRSEVLLHFLEGDKIYISNGSACSSKKKGSRVLDALHVEDKYKEGTIRFSLCEDNSKQEMDIVCEKLATYVKQVRKITKYKG